VSTDSRRTQVLVVEDERDIAALVAYHLTREGYRVRTVADGGQPIGLGESYHHVRAADAVLAKDVRRNGKFSIAGDPLVPGALLGSAPAAWVRQLGTLGFDYGRRIAVDRTAGDASGYACGRLELPRGSGCPRRNWLVICGRTRRRFGAC
jgi:hypothetical protein